LGRCALFPSFLGAFLTSFGRFFAPFIGDALGADHVWSVGGGSAAWAGVPAVFPFFERFFLMSFGHFLPFLQMHLGWQVPCCLSLSLEEVLLLREVCLLLVVTLGAFFDSFWHFSFFHSLPFLQVHLGLGVPCCIGIWGQTVSCTGTQIQVCISCYYQVLIGTHLRSLCSHGLVHL
jgi:hypothetical protein